MATPRSPFIIVQEFISPKQCEAIIDKLPFDLVPTNEKDEPVMSWRHSDYADEIILERFLPMCSDIALYYGTAYRGTERPVYEWYPEGVEGEPQCANSDYLRKKWARTRDRDFTCILFLSEHQDSVPFDPDYECKGGKYQFPQHQFGFNPQRGTLIIYPSGPHFISSVGRVYAGDMLLARWHVAAALPYLHQPDNFPGDYTTWFSGLE